MKVLSYEEKIKLFGDPKPEPLGKNGYAKLSEDFLQNIRYFEFPIFGKLQFHTKVFHQLYNALKTIEERHLVREIDVALSKRMGGTFIPRYQRWDPSKPLSSHAFGIAIDLFSFGSEGVIGKVKWSNEFLKIFEDNGFCWGGNFKSFYDPIHFEICKIII